MVAVLVDTICEANRFKPIYEAIKANWETGISVDRLGIHFHLFLYSSNFLFTVAELS
jgi:hypothetical protein